MFRIDIISLCLFSLHSTETAEDTPTTALDDAPTSKAEEDISMPTPKEEPKATTTDDDAPPKRSKRSKTAEAGPSPTTTTTDTTKPWTPEEMEKLKEAVKKATLSGGVVSEWGRWSYCALSYLISTSTFLPRYLGICS